MSQDQVKQTLQLLLQKELTATGDGKNKTLRVGGYFIDVQKGDDGNWRVTASNIGCLFYMTQSATQAAIYQADVDALMKQFA